eukprot:Selendium_serpulae@DN5293_c0_g1_i4.p2
MAARKFNQTSQFGAVLDQVTDRLSTAALIMLLCPVYPRWNTWFILVLCIDLGGHWFHTHASAVLSSHHKEIPATNPVLRAYYQSRGLMAFSIVCYEGFWLALLTLTKIEKSLFVTALAFIFFPGTLFKTVTNVLQLIFAAERLASLEEKRD